MPIDFFRIGLLYLLFCFLKEYTVFAFILVLFLLAKKKSFLILLFCMLLTLIPGKEAEIDKNEACRITKLNRSGFICQYKEGSILVYSDRDVNYDDEVMLYGSLKDIDAFRSTYSFDSDLYYSRRHIYQCMDDPGLKIIKQGSSLRNKLYAYASKNDNADFIKQYLFCIHALDEDLYDSIIVSGSSFIAALNIIAWLLKHHIQENKVNRICLSLSILLFGFYHANFASFRLMLFTLFKLLKLDNKHKCGIFVLAACLLYPYMIYSAAFWIPFVMLFIGSLHYEKDKWIRMNALMVMQSIFFNAVSPLFLLGGSIIRYVNGICFLTALIILPFKQLSITYFVQLINSVFNLFGRFTLNGNCLGIGFIFIVIIIYKLKHKQLIFSFLFILFLALGWFDPLGSFEMINVSQGDSMLIRAPFNTCNILIDTGKKSQYNHLKTFLDAKGIHTLDLIFISHYDEDHSGSLELLKEDYRVKEIIDTHFNEIKTRYITFYDLNHYEAQDENDNSLILYFEINGLRYLLMGDASITIEKNLINEYNQLTCDVLKAGHHGSSSSTSAEFINTIKPDIALISSGVNNYYGHPDKEVLDILNGNHIVIYNTQTEGDISFKFFYLHNLLMCNNKKIGIISKGENHDYFAAWK